MFVILSASFKQWVFVLKLPFLLLKVISKQLTGIKVIENNNIQSGFIQASLCKSQGLSKTFEILSYSFQEV